MKKTNKSLLDLVNCYLEATIPGKIFEINFGFYVKLCTTGKVQFPFLMGFVLVLTKFSFSKED